MLGGAQLEPRPCPLLNQMLLQRQVRQTPMHTTTTTGAVSWPLLLHVQCSFASQDTTVRLVKLVDSSRGSETNIEYAGLLRVYHYYIVLYGICLFLSKVINALYLVLILNAITNSHYIFEFLYRQSCANYKLAHFSNG
jgi:hypothetical protein